MSIVDSFEERLGSLESVCEGSTEGIEEEVKLLVFLVRLCIL